MKSILVLLTGAATAYAHGYISTITAGGKTFENFNPEKDPYDPNHSARPGWTAKNTDLGFISSGAANTPDVICHKSATPGKSTITVKAGETIDLQWNTWPNTHLGPVIDYLANCGGSCSNVSKTSLKWFKIAQKGFNKGAWGSDELVRNGNKWKVTIPKDLAPGNYVLRHEIIALHGAFDLNGAQLYPQCINFKVIGGGTWKPKGTPGISLYRANAPGLHINIYNGLTSYPIPGPPLAKKPRSHSRDILMDGDQD